MGPAGLRPGSPPADRTGHRADESATDPLHAILDLVYASLPPHLAVAVRSLALAPWPTLTVTVAAAALDTAAEQAAGVLAEWRSVNFFRAPGPTGT
ncbi:hypothetical protein [Streptacidiphilus sp. P02-A3a]|uniref:hypothetical protein n=1 Tax=Streptacidiphilus sp. P02-A3a TaxID=2704468 RepID=UPI0015F9D01D|nr:hypothetical protein [Streptacidiphilus sp. P02-A3a]QMU70273.1 hypothetical protein GXP74_20705 [Streptacidiphilus sp. P02-A3a]